MHACMEPHIGAAQEHPRASARARHVALYGAHLLDGLAVRQGDIVLQRGVASAHACVRASQACACQGLPAAMEEIPVHRIDRSAQPEVLELSVRINNLCAGRQPCWKAPLVCVHAYACLP